MRNCVRSFAVLLVLAFPLAAQQHSNATADRQAYAAARKIADPRQKVEALRKFVAQFPHSNRVDAADSLILETLVKNFPAETGEISKAVKVEEKRASGEYKAFTLDDIADTLVTGGVLLDQAEGLSQKAVKSFSEKSFVKAQESGMRKAKEPVDKEHVEGDYRRYRAEFEATLGRIYVKQGNAAEGRKTLDEALTDDENNSAANAAIGEMEAKAGNQQSALEHLLRARLNGKLLPAQQSLLNDVYKEQHGGSLAGMDEALDRQYVKMFPTPVKVTPYQPGSSAPTRTVLAELFTGAGCDPCAGADLAMDGELERYSRGQLAILMFHEHIPEPDPMANPASVKRFEYYSVVGTPTLALDGQTKIVGAARNDAQNKYQQISGSIDKELRSPAEASLKLSADRVGDSVRVQIGVARVPANSKAVLNVVLVENRLRYSGENGIRFHPMVVRSLMQMPVADAEGAGKQVVFNVDKISASLKAYLDEYEHNNDRFGPTTFIEKKDAIDPSNLSVVAFLQDPESKHILQSAYVDIAGAPANP